MSTQTPATTPALVPGPAIEIPSAKVLENAVRIAMEQDKPLLFDYYMDTKAGGPAYIGIYNETNERILVRNKDEFTSPIKQRFKVKDDYIYVTENSVYVVSGAIHTKPTQTLRYM